MHVADPGGGDSAVGLDPQLFGDLINSLSKGPVAAQALVSSCLSRPEMAQAWERQNSGPGPMAPAGAGYPRLSAGRP